MECPICSTNLAEHDQSAANHHVNTCLDGAQAAPEAPGEDSDDSVEIVAKEEPPQKKQKVSAFNVLMSSHSEQQQINHTQLAQSTLPKQQRQPPFYKILQGMPIAVDAFSSGSITNVTAYFLTHAHSDHYQSLSKTWNAGLIYCSEITANLVHHICGVGRQYLRPLSLNTKHTIPNTNGVTATLIDANHCPGSSIIVFEGKQTVDAVATSYKSPWIGSQRTFRYLHCGDFRASPAHINHPAIQGRNFDIIYLDTTYLNPAYSFPPQPQVIDACRDLVLANLRGEMQVNGSMLDMMKSGFKKLSDGVSVVKGEKEEEDEKLQLPKDVLIVVGTYSIGKERIVKAIAHSLNCKVYADKRRQSLLHNEKDAELNALLTDDPYAAQVHIQGLGGVTINTLPDYIAKFKGNFSRVIGIKPTGWTYKNPNSSTSSNTNLSIEYILKRDLSRWYTYKNIYSTRGSNDYVSCYGVPYSEHSSFTELTCFALSLDHNRIIATVNNSKPASRIRMKNWFDAWLAERKKRCDRGEYTVKARAEDYW